MPAGVPLSDLEDVVDGNIKGAMLTADGRYVRMKKRCEAMTKEGECEGLRPTDWMAINVIDHGACLYLPYAVYSTCCWCVQHLLTLLPS